MESIVSGVGVVDKVAAVLNAVEADGASLAELVGRTGLSRATAHRLAMSLVAHGLLRRDAAGRFQPGLRLIALGRAAADALPLSAAARPALARLRDETGESAQLYVRQGERRVCVAAAESPHGLRTIVPEGATLDLYRGSAGAVLRVDPIAAQQGWAESVGEREAGVASVSAPVFDGEVIVAAVSVSGPLDRTGPHPGAVYAAAVVAAARQIEQACGFTPR